MKLNNVDVQQDKIITTEILTSNQFRNLCKCLTIPNANLIGKIKLDKASRNNVNNMKNKFLNLDIVIDEDNYSIDFEDNLVKQIIETAGYIDITEKEASEFSKNNFNYNSIFAGTDITIFNEFRYFTKVDALCFNDVSAYRMDGFVNCTKLTEITLPKISGGIILGSGSYGCGGFYNCKELKKIGNSEYIKFNYVNGFQYCEKLEYINLGQYATKIPAGTFANCNALQYIYAPYTTEIYKLFVHPRNDGQNNSKVSAKIYGLNNLEILGDSAFKKYNGTKIVIGNKLKSIGNNSFGDIRNHCDIYIKSETPPTFSTSETAEAITALNIKIYVPNTSLSQYINSDIWSDLYTSEKLEGYDFETDTLKVNDYLTWTPENT